MIYDCFVFFNEIDLLKIRLEELKDSVDKFVLVEAAKTFAKRKKPLYFQEYKHEFSEYLDRIVYQMVDDVPKKRLTGWSRRWDYEAHQRNCISRALKRCNCDDNDIILISDVDEIPRAREISEARRLLEVNDFVIFNQKLYMYYLNWISDHRWCGTVACSYKTLKSSSVHKIRLGTGTAKGISNKQRAAVVETHAGQNYPHISDGGWHFSGFGGYDSILYKFQNFSHDCMTAKHEKLDYIKYNVCRSNLQNNKRFLQQFKRWQDILSELPGSRAEHQVYYKEDFEIDRDLPEYLKTNKDKYKHFVKFAQPYFEDDVKISTFGKLYSARMSILHKISRWFRSMKRWSKAMRAHARGFLKDRFPRLFMILKRLKQKKDRT